MTEETEKLLKELVRLVVEERQLLINHIRLTEPISTVAMQTGGGARQNCAQYLGQGQ